MPWEWVSGGLNDAFQYGVLDGSGPVIVDASSGIDFSPGGILTIEYLTGLTSAFGNPGGDVDADGYVGSVFKNDDPGSTGEFFPSLYTPMDWDTFLQALMGVFTDASGSIVGTPFEVGNGPTAVAIPVGATQLQLGFNDDLFADNTGSLRVQVSGPDRPGVVPEPASLLVWAGLAAVGGLAIRRRRAVSV